MSKRANFAPSLFLLQIGRAACRLFFCVFLLSGACLDTAADAPQVSPSLVTSADFPLVAAGVATDVVYSTSDAAVVAISADLFAADVERVSGRRPSVRTSVAAANAPLVLIGTIGASPELDGLIASGKLDVASIRGGWERYKIAVVSSPFPGVSQALVIAGSDRRGTAFGVFSLSEAMGVSPWYWWADVATLQMAEIYVSATPFISKEPSVRYRGIFINDEDWGLQEWSEKTFENGAGEVKDIGPKTYAQVFELLLRLKANYVWPAMHPSTAAFNAYPDNKVVADRYAIIMGSSHAEPMLRNNVYEWSRFVDPANGSRYSSSQFNYQTNQGGVYRYWEQRAIANGAYENVYTLGKRGIHDSGMVEGSGTAEKASWLETIFTDQREILRNHVNADLNQMAQIFVPYKEVLSIYDSGLLDVPDDVTLVWPDDNHGYIRRLSNAAERARSGGGGVYYHLSYWGAPADYLWLNSIPPSLVWSEMTKAYAYNCKRVWIFNVGDIKPAEIGMEFALRLAWDVDRYDENAQMQWFTEWATREFGAEQAGAIASVLNDYHRLGHQRKPEHMNWQDTDPLSPAGPYPLFSHVHFGDEAGRRLAAYADLVARAKAIHAALPANRRSSFYQTVLYPVLGADGMNRKFINAGRAHVAAAQGRNTVAARNSAAQAGYDDILSATQTYNALENGKWNLMMDAKPRDLPVFDMPALPTAPVADTALGIAVEGNLMPVALSPVAAPVIVINAAADGTLTAPMQVSTVGGRQAIWTPNNGANFGVGAGGRATYTVTIPTAGTYTLSFEMYCPSVNDDSWHIQIDGATPVVWNNLNNSGVWTWVDYGAVNLSAGQHTLVVHQREDGAGMASIKFALPDAAGATMEFDAALPTTIAAPMRIAEVVGRQAIWASNGTGNKTSAGSGSRATYAFDVAVSGNYTLSFEVNCPSVEDDSFFIQIDGQTAVEWNNLDTGGQWRWTTFDSMYLSAGAHTLTVHQREDGAAMARVRFTPGGASLREDSATSAFEFLEFNGFTRKSYFLDLFNQGSGSMPWTITTAHPWVKVSKTAGSTGTEERLQVSIDWNVAPRTGQLFSGVTVTSGGLSQTIPVKVWNSATPLPPAVRFVEDNGTVAFEAENYSRLVPAADVTWLKVPGLGSGAGSMQLSPPLVASRATAADVAATSPVLEYNVYLRQAGPVVVTIEAIPTLPVTDTTELRYAVSFDGAAPVLVNMNRTSGSGSSWSRSVLRSSIQYSTTHTLGDAGAHTLKIWMADPGVVLDRLMISRITPPHSYGGPPETLALSHGALSIDAGTTVNIDAGAAPLYDTIVNAGTINVRNGGLFAEGGLVNNGVLRLYFGAVLDIGGTLANHGILDIITWGGALPTSLSNFGEILTRDSVRIENMAMTGNVFGFQVHGYSGHSYQLEEAADGDLSGPWIPIDTPVVGADRSIHYSIGEMGSSPRRFFWVRIDP